MTKYDILLADCPWSYNRKSTGGTNKSGSSQHYECMEFDDLMNLEYHVKNIMNENSVCFLWVTVPMLRDGLTILRMWGYEYKTTITWIKRNNGLGNWFRGKTEHLLMGIRGTVKPFRLQAPNLIISEKTLKYSEKPLESYYIIEQCAIKMGFNTNSRINILELFARTSFSDKVDNVRWTCIGKEITGNDIVTDLQNLMSVAKI